MRQLQTGSPADTHRLTKFTARCLDHGGPFNEARFILQRAMQDLEYGQALYGPAALSA